MPPKGTTGIKNRNYPSLTLMQAMAVPTAIQEGASGAEVSRLVLATLMERSPGSSAFAELLLASRAFGMTVGGVNATTFALTDLGRQATGSDKEQRNHALREAVLKVPPFNAFFEAYDGKRIPAAPAMKHFLVTKAAVPESRADDCCAAILDNGRSVGFIRSVKGGGEWVELKGAGPGTGATLNDTADLSSDDTESIMIIQEEYDSVESLKANGSSNGNGHGLVPVPVMSPSKPKHVFIGHGRNHVPLDQLKAMLGELGIRYKIAVDEPNAGRPIGEKVAAIMKDECSSAIFILSADERFFIAGDDGEMQEIWRPSQNAIYELGAAAVLYGRRIILFKEDRVNLPTDFRDLGHIPFSGDGIGAQWSQLLKELKALGMVEIVVTG